MSRNLLAVLFFFVFFVCNAQSVMKELKFNPLRAWQNKEILKEYNDPDLPSGKEAYLMRSVKDQKGKHVSGHAGTSAVRIGNFDRITVDYDFKAVTPESRYALLVVGGKGERCITLIVEGDSYKVAGTDGHWRDTGKVTFGKWQHIRYVIDPLTGRFDIFIGDMKTPAAANMEFRDRSSVESLRFYSLGHPKVNSETCFANMAITFDSAKALPSATLGRSPYFIAGTGVIDGEPASTDWKNAPVYVLSANTEISEPGECRLLRNQEKLFIRFDFSGTAVPSKRDLTRDGKVWLEDCFQIFIAPSPEKEEYFHFAGNSAGTLYDAKCKAGKRDASWNCDWKAKMEKKADHWSAEVEIPFSALGGSPDNGKYWLFHIGRENPGKNEVISWNLSSDFHNSALWGRLYFFAPQSLPDVYQYLVKELFQVSEKRDGLCKRLLALKTDQNSKEILAGIRRFEQEMKSADAQYASRNDFYSGSQYAARLDALLREVNRLELYSERMKHLFREGGEAAKHGYVAKTHSLMEKINPLLYDGNGSDRLDLSLAGGERGGGLIAVLMKEGQEQNQEVSIACEGLPDWLSAGTFRLMQVEATSPGREPVPYLDILQPGSRFKTGNEKLLVFCVDYQVLRGTSARKYDGGVSLQFGDGKRIRIPVSIRATGFDLPGSRSLDTAFCFDDTWVNEFYGKKMTPSRKRRFLDFIAAHHLEPMNLWGREPDIGLDMIDYCCEKLGKKLLFLKITRLEESRRLIEKYHGRLRPILFGYDEVLAAPDKIPAMRMAYQKAAKTFPQVDRLNTSMIDQRLFGAVSLWCPLFSNFKAEDAARRKALGEKVWWYPTEGPRKPYANFNLDSPGIDPRIIPWMNWKLKIDGLLYWALNREWRTNGMDGKYLNDEEVRRRGLEWFTPKVKEGMNSGKLRFPRIPWLSYFRSVITNRTSREAGAGNLMYPGPDFEPWPSLRLKNLRDGLQDYEYFVLLSENVKRLKKAGKAPELMKRAEKALEIRHSVVTSATDYTKDPAVLMNAKRELAELITETNKVLK